jgi:hypothetical protein
MEPRIDWDSLDEERKTLLSNYLYEVETVTGTNRVRFTKKECSCCGEVGFVPEKHRFLCVFCYETAHYFDESVRDLYEQMRRTASSGYDKVRMNIPIGIKGTIEEPEVYNTTVYSTKDMTQEELQALIP